MSQRASKRLIDILGAVTGLVLASPLMIIIALAVRIRLGSPVFYRQRRIGLGGTEFLITKFRTMSDHKDDSGVLLPDAERLTRLGRALRELSLDELPELWDVLRGRMSLVGPRPLPVRYRNRYRPDQWRRHEVKPGITGLAQVKGRNALSWEEKFDYDVRYVDTWTLRTDAAILLQTVGAFFSRRGITAQGHATMPEFLGDEG